jgi:hypothetical protein
MKLFTCISVVFVAAILSFSCAPEGKPCWEPNDCSVAEGCLSVDCINGECTDLGCK